jgi:hypothetical protein
VLFRQTFAQLDEIIRRAKQIYIPLGGEYHKAENYFSFPAGPAVHLRYLATEEDCGQYQGHSYTWIGFDELGNYRTDYA